MSRENPRRMRARRIALVGTRGRAVRANAGAALSRAHRARQAGCDRQARARPRGLPRDKLSEAARELREHMDAPGVRLAGTSHGDSDKLN